MSKTDLKNQENKESMIVDLVQNLSSYTFAEMRKIEGLKTEVYHKNGDKVLGHWVAAIILGGSDIRLTFAAYFHISKVKALLKKHGLKHDFPEEDIISLLKEYCNLVAGKLKRSMNDSNISVGTSIPFMARGYDYVLLEMDKERDTSVRKTWLIGDQESGFYCSVMAKLLSGNINWPHSTHWEEPELENAIELL